MSCPTPEESPPCLRVADLETARRFYVHVLGCLPAPPRESLSEHTLELELHGHTMSLIAEPSAESIGLSHAVIVLGVDDWCTVSERLRAHAVDVVVQPVRRFSAIPGEQCAMRLNDPDGNAIELRGFAAEAGLLAA